MAIPVSARAMEKSMSLRPAFSTYAIFNLIGDNKDDIYAPTVRAEALCLRTYQRKKANGNMESWADVVQRFLQHQAWLWLRQINKDQLSLAQVEELTKLGQLVYRRKVLPPGRVLFIGGTPVAYHRESATFNCAFTFIRTVDDVADFLWLLLQGCGVGFRPCTGELTGFNKHLDEITFTRSTRSDCDGIETTTSTITRDWYLKKRWVITVGDSAEGWANALRMLLKHDNDSTRLHIDFSNIRPNGSFLIGYGWRTDGDIKIHRAMKAITDILNSQIQQPLTTINILDLCNWCGAMLSARRSAQIAILPYNHPDWEEFARAKKDYFLTGNLQRQQSNNSLLFEEKPSKAQLEFLFKLMGECGGSEPGFLNAVAARKRAPWFEGCNPCGEILLSDKSFCNLSEVVLPAFKNNTAEELEEAIYLLARANYRQTSVNLNDGMLQPAWHENNQKLHLCGVGLTGVLETPDITDNYSLRRFNRIAVAGAYSMAREMNSAYPCNITTIKPSGTLSKIAGTVYTGEISEGVHRPLGRYIFNNVNFNTADPLVPALKQAHYKSMINPADPESTLITFPVEFKGIEFEKFSRKIGKDKYEDVEVNMETAIDQLDRYKQFMQNYCEQNVSVTVSYNRWEVGAIINWLLENWDYYVGVSFIYRADTTLTAADLGYQYLPQEVVTKRAFDEYSSTLSAVQLPMVDSEFEPEACVGGACPAR